MKKVNIGLVGAGTVGSGVIKLLTENKDILTKKTGIDFNLKYVVDKDISKLKGLDNVKTSDDFKIVIEDKEINIVVELTGGLDFPWQLLQDSVAKGKHFVTANKALLSKKLYEIYETVRKNKIYLGFEASVAGGIPIIKTLKYYLVGNKILSIEGIINGTTNYILTKMSDEKLEFQNSLKKAQELGFAESDPTLDISGGDAASKIAILASIAFDQNISLEDVYVEGIENVELFDIEHAKELGYVIKLVATCKLDQNGQIEIRVHPTLLEDKNPLSSVKNEFNAILVNADFLGLNMYYGKGAGERPTASAIVSDIVDIAVKITNKKEFNANYYTLSNKKNIKPISSIESEYYIRMMTKDRPGILGEITTIFGKHNISIASVIQKETGKVTVPIVFTTHKTIEKQLIDSLTIIKKYDFVDSLVFYRILN